MKLNIHVVELTIDLCLLTIAAASWAHGLTSITLSMTALLILGAAARILAARPARVQPHPVRADVVESERKVENRVRGRAGSVRAFRTRG